MRSARQTNFRVSISQCAIWSSHLAYWTATGFSFLNICFESQHRAKSHLVLCLSVNILITGCARQKQLRFVFFQRLETTSSVSMERRGAGSRDAQPGGSSWGGICCQFWVGKRIHQVAADSGLTQDIWPGWLDMLDTANYKPGNTMDQPDCNTKCTWIKHTDQLKN